MEQSSPRQVTVHNDNEFYITVAMLKKPITIRPLSPTEGKTFTLTEMECKALVVPPDAVSNCQCCTGDFPPSYPFVVEESRD